MKEVIANSDGFGVFADFLVQGFAISSSQLFFAYALKIFNQTMCINKKKYVESIAAAQFYGKAIFWPVEVKVRRA